MKVLPKNPRAAVKLPDYVAIQAYKRAMHCCHSRLPDIFAVADELKIYLTLALFIICFTMGGSTIIMSKTCWSLYPMGLLLHMQ